MGEVFNDCDVTCRALRQARGTAADIQSLCRDLREKDGERCLRGGMTAGTQVFPRHRCFHRGLKLYRETSAALEVISACRTS